MRRRNEVGDVHLLLQVVAEMTTGTKIGIETSQRFASLGDVDVLVTDAGIEAAEQRAFEKAGIEVVVA